jgi:hypothetical protein
MLVGGGRAVVVVVALPTAKSMLPLLANASMEPVRTGTVGVSGAPKAIVAACHVAPPLSEYWMMGAVFARVAYPTVALQPANTRPPKAANAAADFGLALPIPRSHCCPSGDVATLEATPGDSIHVPVATHAPWTLSYTTLDAR